VIVSIIEIAMSKDSAITSETIEALQNRESLAPLGDWNESSLAEARTARNAAFEEVATMAEAALAGLPRTAAFKSARTAMKVHAAAVRSKIVQ